MPIDRLTVRLEPNHCSILAPTLVTALRRAHDRGEHVDEMFVSLVTELSTVARVYRNSIADGRQLRMPCDGIDAEVCHDWVGSEVASAMLGVKARRARGIVATLPGAHKVRGAWKVERGQVEKLRQARGLP